MENLILHLDNFFVFGGMRDLQPRPSGRVIGLWTRGAAYVVPKRFTFVAGAPELTEISLLADLRFRPDVDTVNEAPIA